MNLNQTVTLDVQTTLAIVAILIPALFYWRMWTKWLNKFCKFAFVTAPKWAASNVYEARAYIGACVAILSIYCGAVTLITGVGPLEKEKEYFKHATGCIFYQGDGKIFKNGYNQFFYSNGIDVPEDTLYADASRYWEVPKLNEPLNKEIAQALCGDNATNIRWQENPLTIRTEDGGKVVSHYCIIYTTLEETTYSPWHIVGAILIICIFVFASLIIYL